jgi:anti-anti-sigma regulatory factor
MLPLRVHEIQVERLEGTAAAELARTLVGLFAGRPRAVILDLSRVATIDAFASAVISTTLRRAPKGSVLVLAGISTSLRAAPHVAVLHGHFDVYVDVEAATRALGALTAAHG